MIDLSVDFCGLRLENPFLLSSAPPTRNGELIQRAFDLGWAGAVTKTLGQRPMDSVRPRFVGLKVGDDLAGFGNVEQITDKELEEWLIEIRGIKRDYPDKIVVASAMAPADPEKWRTLIQRINSSGPDMIELNLSCPHMAEKGLGSDIGEDPERTEEVVKWVKEVAEVPVMAKLTPNVTDIVAIGRGAKRGGADALSAINTIRAFMGIDLETMEPKLNVDGLSSFSGLSGPCIKPIALRCVVQLAKIELPISGIGGITDWRDATEFLLCGAATLQMATAVMRYGYGIIRDLKDGLSNYLQEKGFTSVNDIIGKMVPKVVPIGDLDLSYKVISEIDQTRCIGCGLCYVACRDGGYSAIAFGEDRVPEVDEEKCDGCSLCMQVCPVLDCVRMKVVE
jgi:dihydropyrimidine dehydrogenase (NAD+) subunit PreA